MSVGHRFKCNVCDGDAILLDYDPNWRSKVCSEGCWKKYKNIKIKEFSKKYNYSEKVLRYFLGINKSCKDEQALLTLSKKEFDEIITLMIGLDLI